MSGLILVSHSQNSHSTLATIYESILARRGGMWVKWSGEFETLSSELHRELNFNKGNEYDTLTFRLTKAEYEEGYHQYIHQGLWPVFHQRPDMARFSTSSQIGYMRLNETYARAISDYAMPDDDIWLQDYHLIPSIKMLRDAGLINRIGFFFHQPFPAGQSFESIPNWRYLADSLLCADLIGFQTTQDMNNFTAWVESRFRCEHLSPYTLRIHGRQLSVGVFPVGIDTAETSALAESNSCLFMEQQCRETLPENIILSSGHFDDSTGTPYRISAIEVLLRQHEEYHHKFSLVQLASMASGYSHRIKELSRDLETRCGEMNGIHGELNWYPVSYLSNHYSREELCGFYRAARVALVTPLIAGMSLMAKTYVAVQDHTNPGVLILSQFAGAAEQMQGALVVNPYDPDAIADAIHTALIMPLSVRRERHASLMKNLHLHNCYTWAEAFINALQPREQEADLSVKSGVMLSNGFSGRLRY
ncbi:trehalose-6-phosphate synthase [Pantoea sp. NPDC088449]|uniref:alpha,alpha-trehalose-phosphate synthase (UDP-forming) n=1 Tax=Pantoea sp. NPDC088449 TaxID=3364392 RepID=UPI003805D9DD